MHPILFKIPLPHWKLPMVGELHAFPIYSYGVMLGLSLIVGWYLSLTLAKNDGLPREAMANNYIFTAIMAIVGSRLLYVVTNLDEMKTWHEIFAIRSGGLVAYGGFLGGFLGSWIYCARKKIRLMAWADVAVPSLASGLMITRIGCYLFGCDFGKPLTESSPQWLQKLGTFPHWTQGTVDRGDGSPAWIQHVNQNLISHDAVHSLPVHPTQLYESLLGWGLFALLMYQRRHQKFRGQVFMLFAFSYGLGRFLLEIVRDDLERGAFGPELGAHILIPGSLALFGAGYAISFAMSIPNLTMRRLTQVLAFVPAIVAYLIMRPSNFMTAQIIQLSTSQWVGVLTAVAVSVAFVIYYKGAEAHPEAAMELHLHAFYEQEDAQAAKAEGKSEAGGGRKDEGDDDEAPVQKPRKKKKKAEAPAGEQKADDTVEAAFDDDKGEDKAVKSGETVEAAFDGDKSEGKSEGKSEDKSEDKADEAGKSDDDKKDG